MAQTASPLYIVFWAFFPAAIDIEAYMSNVYANVSSAQHHAEAIWDFLRNKDTEGISTDNSFPCTVITEDRSLVHPLDVPYCNQPGQEGRTKVQIRVRMSRAS